MNSEVLIFHEIESWMKQRMWVVPSQVAQLTLPLAWNGMMYYRYGHNNILPDTVHTPCAHAHAYCAGSSSTYPCPYCPRVVQKYLLLEIYFLQIIFPFYYVY